MFYFILFMSFIIIIIILCCNANVLSKTGNQMNAFNLITLLKCNLITFELKHGLRLCYIP